MKNLLCFVMLCLAGIAVCADYPVYPEITAPFRCKGKWTTGHLQGFDADKEHIYWIFTRQLVKTDLQGNVIKEVAIRKEAPKAIHGGDPCVVDGIVYVPFGTGFNKVPKGPNGPQSYIQLYDTDLNYIKSIYVPDVLYGAGGMTYADGHFFVIGGRPWDMPGNTVLEYDKEFRFIRAHELPMNTYLGIQTIMYDGTHFYFGCYNMSRNLFRVDRNFKNLEYFSIQEGAFGMIPLKGGKILYATSVYEKEGNVRYASSEGKIMDVEKFLQKVNVITCDSAGKLTLDGAAITEATLPKELKKRRKESFVIRFAADVPVSKVVAIRGLVTGIASRDAEIEILR